MNMNSLIRIGKVSSTYPEKATVKVVFSDIDNLVTAELPVLMIQGLKNKFFAMPDVGENVLCLFLEQGIGDGFCIGSFYTETETPPVIEQDKVHYLFEDGTYIEYDRKEHKLIADIQGNADIKVKDVTLEAENVTATCKNLVATTQKSDITSKDVTLNSTALTINSQKDIITSQDVTLNCTTLTINAEKDIIIQSGTKITLQGKVQKEEIL